MDILHSTIIGYHGRSLCTGPMCETDGQLSLRTAEKSWQVYRDRKGNPNSYWLLT